MFRVNLAVAGALLIIASSILVTKGLTEGKHWPDFSCHPTNESALQRNAFLHHRMNWESCRKSFQKYKERCDKVCMLINRDVMYRMEATGPLIFNITVFVTNVAAELGYDMNEPEVPQQQLMDKIRSGLVSCIQKYPEYQKLMPRKSTCEPWLNLTQCIDGTIGCYAE